MVDRAQGLKGLEGFEALKFGQLHLFESPAGRSEREVIGEQVELMVAAEHSGFDSVWIAEHHFTEYGYCGSPAVTLAAVAARTERIRLGTAVVVLPLNHPVRVAEDYAFLDNLSGGRVDVGVGRGYQPGEFDGYDVDQGASRAMFAESLDVIHRAWTEDRFSYDGEFYRVRDLCVRPRPVQQPHPPLWMAALSPESFDLCARFGLNLMCAPVFGFDLDTGVEHIERYRRTIAQQDGAGDARDEHDVAALAITYVAETSQQARAELRDAVLWYYRTLARYIAPAGDSRPRAGFELYGAAREFLETVDWDTTLERGAVVCGSPAEVTDRIEALRERCGLTHYLAWTRIGGLDRARVLRSMELMGERVMPAFR